MSKSRAQIASDYYQRNRDRILEHQKERNRLRYHSIKRFVSSYKLTAGCQHCGYAENPAALELAHITPVGGSQNRERLVNWRRVRTMLEECQVLCANCHRIEDSLA